MTTNEKQMRELYQDVSKNLSYQKAYIYQQVLVCLLETYNPYKLIEHRPNVITKNITIDILNLLEANEWQQHQETFLKIVCAYLRHQTFTKIQGVIDIKALIEASKITFDNALRMQNKITFNGDIWGYGEIPKKPPVTSPKVSNFSGRGSGR